jgi:hypothetical protein
VFGECFQNGYFIRLGGKKKLAFMKRGVAPISDCFIPKRSAEFWPPKVEFWSLRVDVVARKIRK